MKAKKKGQGNIFGENLGTVILWIVFIIIGTAAVYFLIKKFSG